MAQGQPAKVKSKKKSVLTRAAQARQRAEVNRVNRTRVRTMMRRLRTAHHSAHAGAVHAVDFGPLTSLRRALQNRLFLLLDFGRLSLGHLSLLWHVVQISKR